MASLISTTELKEHVETDLSTDALQRIIDAEEQDIVERFGPHESQTDMREPVVSTRHIYPSRHVDSVTSIVERVGTTNTTLAADDYEVVNEIRIDRLTTGSHPRTYWGDRVTVTYTPKGDTDKRKRVLIDLCKLTIQYNALKSENIGDHRADYSDYQRERLQILSALGGRWWA